MVFGASEAEAMYADLGKALRKVWGPKRKFRVVEDGDRKGFQSGKGKDEKKAQKIESWGLPVRTPEWMPLDFSLWAEIEERVLGNHNYTDETAKAYKARVRRVAATLSRPMVKRVLARVPEQIVATDEAKGKHLKRD